MSSSRPSMGGSLPVRGPVVNVRVALAQSKRTDVAVGPPGAAWWTARRTSSLWPHEDSSTVIEGRPEVIAVVIDRPAENRHLPRSTARSSLILDDLPEICKP